jgi:glutathione S-transferase
MQAVTAAAADVAKFWGRLNLVLVGRPYLAGDHFTVGDIAVGCWVHSWFALDLQRPDLQSLSVWYRRLQMRPAYARHVMVPLT